MNEIFKLLGVDANNVSKDIVPRTKNASFKQIPCKLYVEYDNFGNIIFKNERGQLHNLNGFAIQMLSEPGRYFINDTEFTREEWLNERNDIIEEEELVKQIELKNQELKELLEKKSKLHFCGK